MWRINHVTDIVDAHIDNQLERAKVRAAADARRKTKALAEASKVGAPHSRAFNLQAWYIYRAVCMLPTFWRQDNEGGEDEDLADASKSPTKQSRQCVRIKKVGRGARVTRNRRTGVCVLVLHTHGEPTGNLNKTPPGVQGN